jgi:hypothetical protein
VEKEGVLEVNRPDSWCTRKVFWFWVVLVKGLEGVQRCGLYLEQSEVAGRQSSQPDDHVCGGGEAAEEGGGDTEGGDSAGGEIWRSREKRGVQN